MPNRAEKNELIRISAEVSGLLCAADFQETFLIVAKLAAEYATANISALSVEALTDAYVEAVGDHPTWAVAEAVRRLHRRQWWDNFDYRFKPPAADLARAVADVLMPVRRVQRQALDVLDAQAVIEPTPAQVKATKKRLAELQKVFHSAAKIPPRNEVLRDEAWKKRERTGSEHARRIMPDLEKRREAKSA